MKYFEYIENDIILLMNYFSCSSYDILPFNLRCTKKGEYFPEGNKVKQRLLLISGFHKVAVNIDISYSGMFGAQWNELISTLR